MTSQPIEWSNPEWHSDFGNPEKEIELLKVFCSEAFQVFEALSTNLVSPEEGLLFVEIFLSNNKVAELYIVEERGGKKYSLFTFNKNKETGEYYFNKVSDGIKLLSKKTTS